MRAPRFWYKDPGLGAALLAPLGALYAAGTARRFARGDKVDPGIPVVCVGNLNAGGTGKTPTVIALLERLKQRAQRPAVISRGYGGTVTGPHLVNERQDTAATVGDEPLLIAAFAPTWVGADRARTARAAVEAGANVLVMDDGLQSGALKIDLGLVVVDAMRGFGNGRCMPAGPLREPADIGLARADAVLSIGAKDAQARFREAVQLPAGLPHLVGKLNPLQTGMDWQGLRVLAFAGIGFPEKFFGTLRALGADVVETHALSDHQPLEDRLLHRLQQRAAALGARLVATEKDAVRLPQSMRTEVLTVPVRLGLEDWAPVDAMFDRLGL